MEAGQIFTLEDFLAEIARLTGLYICIYDVSDFTCDVPHLKVSAPSRWHYSTFCQGVKSNPEAAKKCIAESFVRAFRSFLGVTPHTFIRRQSRQ